MSNQWNQWHDDDEGDDTSSGQDAKGGLRAHARKVEQENKQLRETIGKLQAQVRLTTISQVLADKGVSPKVAKLVPGDVESTPEAVEKWLADNSDLFPPAQANQGEGSASSQTAGQDASGSSEDDRGDEAGAGQMGRISAAVNGATTPTKTADMMAALRDPSLTREKLMEMVHAAGGGMGAG